MCKTCRQKRAKRRLVAPVCEGSIFCDLNLNPSIYQSTKRDTVNLFCLQQLPCMTLPRLLLETFSSQRLCWVLAYLSNKRFNPVQTDVAGNLPVFSIQQYYENRLINVFRASLVFPQHDVSAKDKIQQGQQQTRRHAANFFNFEILKILTRPNSFGLLDPDPAVHTSC